VAEQADRSSPQQKRTTAGDAAVVVIAVGRTRRCPGRQDPHGHRRRSFVTGLAVCPERRTSCWALVTRGPRARVPGLRAFPVPRPRPIAECARWASGGPRQFRAQLNGADAERPGLQNPVPTVPPCCTKSITADGQPSIVAGTSRWAGIALIHVGLTMLTSIMLTATTLTAQPGPEGSGRRGRWRG
jgi:hypothetical protein